MADFTGTTKHGNVRRVLGPGSRAYACVAEIVGARRSVGVIPGIYFQVNAPCMRIMSV